MKKNLFALICCVMLTGTCLMAQTGEVHRELSGCWDFKTDPYYKGETGGWFAPEHPSSGWDKMKVPGNWELTNEYAQYSGWAWYRTTFLTPPHGPSQRLALRFEAVGIHYAVWLNHTLLGRVTGGYFPVEFEIGAQLKPERANTLTVCVDNNFRSGAYWSWGGIRRPVTLRTTPKEYIRAVRIQADPDLKSGKAAVNATIDIDYEQLPAGYDLECVIEQAGKKIASKQLTLSTGSTSIASRVSRATYQLQFHLPARQVHLWSFDHPHLYTMRTVLRRKNAVVHQSLERFGIRKAEVKNGLFLFNGEPVRLLGYNWVADDRFTGNTLPHEVYKRHIDEMKAAGANMARLSHVPLPKDVLDYIDEVGMLIVDEIPVWGTSPYATPHSEIPFQWLKQLIDCHYNHPCVIGWSVGNEIGNQTENPEVMGYVKKAVDYAHTLDPSRLAMDVSNTAGRVDDPSEYSDLLMLNMYGGNYKKSAIKVSQLHGNKPLFFSEFGHGVLTRGLKEDFSVEARALADMRGSAFLFGASVWTYNDYRSNHHTVSPAWDTNVTQNRAWGVVDAYGNKKVAYERARKEYAVFRQMTVTEQASISKAGTSKADVPEVSTYEVILYPRQVLDLPAFILCDYTLTLTSFNRAGRRLAATTTSLPLPVVKPGDKPFTQHISTAPLPAEAAFHRIAVCSPQGVELMDTTLYLQAPQPPVIKEIIAGRGQARIYFDPTPDAQAYLLNYESEDHSYHSDTVSTPYIDLRKLPHQQEFRVTLTAINPKGKTISPSRTFRSTLRGYLPPLVSRIKALGERCAIAIGYSCEVEEYMYEVEYATSADMKAGYGHFHTQLKGACFIPDCEPGQTYYVRMRSFVQHEQASEWSPIYRVEMP